jgi:hypothetical protein
MALTVQYCKCPVNHRRCRRLPGKGKVPDRSSDISCHPLARGDLADAFIDLFADQMQFDSESVDLIASVERLEWSRTGAANSYHPTTLFNWTERGCGDSSAVKI